MGRLLHDLGLVSAKDVHKNQREAAAAGKVRVQLRGALRILCASKRRVAAGAVDAVVLHPTTCPLSVHYARKQSSATPPRALQLRTRAIHGF
jgi:hypothetical protein